MQNEVTYSSAQCERFAFGQHNKLFMISSLQFDLTNYCLQVYQFFIMRGNRGKKSNEYKIYEVVFFFFHWLAWLQNRYLSRLVLISKRNYRDFYIFTLTCLRQSPFNLVLEYYMSRWLKSETARVNKVNTTYLVSMEINKQDLI